MYASVKAPGSCGELVQGVMGGRNFLVTCPINKYSVATVKIFPHKTEIVGTKAKSKACQAVQRTLAHFNCSYGAEVQIESQLPVGKGMASSTADLSAAALATALALGEHLSLEEIADIALGIEPSDGTFYPGIALFDHVQGTVRRILGNPPAMKILIVDLGGEVDTVEFNRQEGLWAKNLSKEKEISKALELIERGIALNSPKLIGEGASISSLANQIILYKPGLEDLLETVLKNGGYGINVAHSGTVVGILLDAADNRIQEWQYLVRTVLKSRVTFYQADLVGGGLVPLEEQKKEMWCG